MQGGLEAKRRTTADSVRNGSPRKSASPARILRERTTRGTRVRTVVGIRIPNHRRKQKTPVLQAPMMSNWSKTAWGCWGGNHTEVL